MPELVTPDTVLLTLLWVTVGSFFVGVLGGTLGVGGGVFLVPFLVFTTSLRPIEAVGLSLFCVMGTSIGGAGRALSRGDVNVGLGLWMELFMLIGTVAASIAAQKVSDAALMYGFAVLMLGVGAAFIFRAVKAGAVSFEAPAGAPSLLDGCVLDKEGNPIHYRAQRRWALAVLTCGTGAASGLFGIGGGVLNVPFLTFVGRVPLAAAAATSTFTMAATGAAGAAIHLAHGTVPAGLICASLLGVIPGGRVGARLRERLPARVLTILFASLACAVAAASFWRGANG